MDSISKKKKFIIISIILIIFWIFVDLVYSRFIHTDISYGCLDFNDKNNFYNLKSNCIATEKLVKTSPAYKIFTDKNGYRYSGKIKKDDQENLIVFLGDSFTYGVGLNFEETFVGKIQKININYEVLNLAVPSYSPTTYLYQLESLIKKNIVPKKIVLMLDLTDVSDEASRWKINENNQKPSLRVSSNIDSPKQDSDKNKFKEFKNKNFKGSRMIFAYINNQIRLIKIKFLKKISKDYSELGITKTGDFTYKDYENLETKLWLPLGFEGGLKKIKSNVKKISIISNKINADFYIVIYPWAVTLQYGQKIFNWENFGDDLCNISNCRKLISLFDVFNEEKEKHENWSTDLFFLYDTHWNEKGHDIVAKSLLEEIF